MMAALTRQLVMGAAIWKAFMRRQVERWVIGLIWLVTGGVIGILGVMAVLCSLFFQLASMPQWATPSLITGVVALLLAGLLALEGKRQWR